MYGSVFQKKKWTKICIQWLIKLIKLKTGIGNVSKRHKLDKRAENSQRLSMSLQHSEKNMLSEACFSWHETKMCTQYISKSKLKIMQD